MDDWTRADGAFLFAHGRSLRTLDSKELFNTAYYLLLNEADNTKEQMEARDNIKKAINDAVREYETGIPTAALMFQPADAMFPPVVEEEVK